MRPFAAFPCSPQRFFIRDVFDEARNEFKPLPIEPRNRKP
jgi:hypothetical protein